MAEEEKDGKKVINGCVKRPLIDVNLPGIIEDISENHPVESSSSEIKQSKWKMVRETSHRIAPRLSKGEIKLKDLITELQTLSIDDRIPSSDEILLINSKDWLKRSRQYLSRILSQPKFHYFIIILVIIDLLVVLVDLLLAQLSAPCLTDDEMQMYNTSIQRDTCLLPYSNHLTHVELFLFYFSVFLLLIFVSEVFLSFYTFSWRHFRNPLYLSDGIIVLASFMMEIYFHYGNIGRAGRAAAALVVLRLWKIVRAIHAVAHSITLKNRLLIEKIQEAQKLIEEEKFHIETNLQKQEIKLDYLINLLKSIGKLPSTQSINNYVEKVWQTRITTT